MRKQYFSPYNIMEMTNWAKKETYKFLKEYGDIPPPWIIFPQSHPYEIMWRMGYGESYMDLLKDWLTKEKRTEIEKIEYFKKYPAPPRWMAWKAREIWDLKPWETENSLNFDYSPYFKKLKELGFHGIDDYEDDLSDEKWLER